MPLEATYHTANLLTTAFFCGAFAGLLGYAWGQESAQTKKGTPMVTVEIWENYGFEDEAVSFVLEFKTPEAAAEKLSKLGFFKHEDSVYFSSKQADVWAVLSEPVCA